MPSLTALTIYAFGFSAIHLSLNILLRPTSALTVRRLPASSLPELNAFAVAALGIGIYYVLAAWQENRVFFVATLLRVVSAGIFWQQGRAWRAVAKFEGASALVTAMALAWEGGV